MHRPPGRCPRWTRKGSRGFFVAAHSYLVYAATVKIKILLSLALVALLACVARAALYPQGRWVMFSCLPPNAGNNGVYVAPDSTTYYYWGGGINSVGVYMEPGWYDENPVSIGRDVEIVPTTIEPPGRPSWAIFDAEPDGTYYFGGGYYNGHYFTEGYYLPNEIW